jgi:hypothetical protein
MFPLKLSAFHAEFNFASNTVIENISNDNLKNILRKVKLTETRSNTVSIWLITFERIDIKISAFRKFVELELAFLVHSSKFKIEPIFIEQ